VRKILRPRPTRPHSQNAIKRCGTRPTNTVAIRHSAVGLAQSPSANVHERQSPDWRGLARCSVVVAEPLRTHFWRKGRDSNPRYGETVHRISSPAHSTTLPPFRMWSRLREGAHCICGPSVSWCVQRQPSQARFAQGGAPALACLQRPGVGDRACGDALAGLHAPVRRVLRHRAQPGGQRVQRPVEHMPA
jgi:hypothetical protein